MRLPVVLLFLLVISQSSVISPAYGQVMTNGSYILEQGGFGSFAGTSSGPQNTLTDSGGKLSPGVYQGTNYIMRANFNYGEVASSSSSFSFAISNTSVNFGSIKPGEPLVRTNILTVSSPSGYEVSVSENNPLKNPQGASIPDTTCDSGSCTQSVPALWTSPLTYGFGYRCDNVSTSDACSSSFTTANYFMQFANSETSEQAATVMSGTEPVSNSQVQITYKLNVASTQPPGAYQNTIKYVAVPSL